MAVKARALWGLGAGLVAALWHLGEAPPRALRAEPFERWLWPPNVAPPRALPGALGPSPAASEGSWGPILWLMVGPPPHLPACYREAQAAGLPAADVCVLPVPHLPLLHGRLCAALSAPHVAVVLLDARGWEAEALGLLGSRRFYGALAQRRAGAGARLVVLGHAWG